MLKSHAQLALFFPRASLCVCATPIPPYRSGRFSNGILPTISFFCLNSMQWSNILFEIKPKSKLHGYKYIIYATCVCSLSRYMYMSIYYTFIIYIHVYIYIYRCITSHWSGECHWFLFRIWFVSFHLLFIWFICTAVAKKEPFLACSFVCWPGKSLIRHRHLNVFSTFRFVCSAPFSFASRLAAIQFNSVWFGYENSFHFDFVTIEMEMLHLVDESGRDSGETTQPSPQGLTLRIRNTLH